MYRHNVLRSLSDGEGDVEIGWTISTDLELSEYLRAVVIGRDKRSPYLWSGRPF